VLVGAGDDELFGIIGNVQKKWNGNNNKSA